MKNTKDGIKDQPGHGPEPTCSIRAARLRMEGNACRRALRPSALRPASGVNVMRGCDGSRTAPVWMTVRPRAGNQSKGDLRAGVYAVMRTEAETQAAKNAPSRKAFTAS